MDKRLIIHLQRRTLAEYSVFMTICGVGAFIIGMIVTAFLPDGWLPSGSRHLGAILMIWAILMIYLWLHFRAAARRAGLGISSTALFHTIQGASIVLAVSLVFLARSAGWPLFVVIAFGAEVAVAMFFISYLLLAATLCRRLPLSAVLGLGFAVLGVVVSYQHVLALEFFR